MAWTKDLQAAAQAEGWQLIDCVDSGSSRPVLRIFGLTSRENQRAQKHVMEKARFHSTLHIAALREIQLSSVQGKKK